MEHDVFISYSTKNREAAQAICHVLEHNNIRCWMAPRDIPGGAQYGDVIDDAIKNSKVFVIVFSEAAQTSQWVNGELNVAFELNKAIIPFKLEETPLKGQIKVMLNQKHWIDAYPDYKTKFNDLVSAVSLALGVKIELEDNLIKESFFQKTKKGKKVLVFLLIGLFVMISAIFLYSYITKINHTYSYNKNGLHVHTKTLNNNQESAITSILDDMLLIEGGSFMMGNTPEMEYYLTELDSLSNILHKVELSNFYICKHEVTQKQWKAFMSTDGRCIINNDNAPMDMLSWEDAIAFTDSLSLLTGLSFSLPTEAQWEFAARGGVKSNHYVFSGNNDPTEVGWTSFENLESAHEVGGKRYNELGLYDMTGNVSEWCLDYFAPYDSKAKIDPKGPTKGLNKVLRGGDFRIENLFDIKVTSRYQDGPFSNRKGTGMRLVINIK